MFIQADSRLCNIGNAYKVSVVAFHVDEVKGTSQATLNIPTVTELATIQLAVDQLSQLGLPRDDALRDLDAIYMSSNLLNQSIRVLGERVNEGNTSSGIYRLLGDRYLEAGFPDIAQHMYDKASAISKRL